jgi:RNA polymerase primary sigma factor
MPRSSKVKSAAIDDQSEAVEEVLAKSPVAGDVAGLPEVPGVGNINDKIRHLIRLSKEQGYLTFDDINEALPESVENQEEIDNVLSILQNLEIEILEPDQVETTRRARKRPKRKRAAPRKMTSSTTPSGCISSKWAKSRS